MLKVRYSSRFKKDFKSIIKRGFDSKLFEKSLDLLINEKPLSEEYLDHPLYGEYGGHRECHIAPDWLLIYKIEKNVMILNLTRTGSHSDLF